LWDTPRLWFSLKTLFVMFLSVGHCNFMFLVYGTLVVSPGQFFSSIFVCGTLCGVSQTFTKLECVIDKNESNDVF
jgi:hypothetical protein